MRSLDNVLIHLMDACISSGCLIPKGWMVCLVLCFNVRSEDLDAAWKRQDESTFGLMIIGQAMRSVGNCIALI